MSGNQGLGAWLEIRFAHCLEKNVPVRNPDLSPPIQPGGHQGLPLGVSPLQLWLGLLLNVDCLEEGLQSPSGRWVNSPWGREIKFPSGFIKPQRMVCFLTP